MQYSILLFNHFMKMKINIKIPPKNYDLNKPKSPSNFKMATLAACLYNLILEINNVMFKPFGTHTKPRICCMYASIFYAVPIKCNLIMYLSILCNKIIYLSMQYCM